MGPAIKNRNINWYESDIRWYKSDILGKITMKWAFFDSIELVKPRKHKRPAAAHREPMGWRRAVAKTIDAGSPGAYSTAGSTVGGS